MKLAEYIINYLGGMGIDRAFLVQGAANNDLIYAIADCPKMDYVCMQHEQAAGFAAEGWAKIKGNGIPGLAISTSGPGAQNMVTCAANCWFDSTPAIFITGQINSQFMRPNNRIRQVGFQESPTVDLFRPITKYAAMVTEPKDARFHLQYALHRATEGRPGPVLLDIPMDVQKKDVDASGMEGFRAEPPDYNLFRVREQIAAFIEDLAKAKRPVIIVGGGARAAADAIHAIADRLGIPCFPTWNAIDIITDDHINFGGRIGTYGGKGRNFAIQKADLVLTIGCRISGRITGGKPDTFMPHAKKYMVDVDSEMMERETMQVKFDELIRCDARLFCDELWKTVQGIDYYEAIKGRELWQFEANSLRDTYDPVRPEHMTQDTIHAYAFFRNLSKEMSRNDILVGDCGGNVVCLNHAFETKCGQRVLSNHGNSPMGFSMAGAIGAWYASDKTGRVVCTIGDGGMQLNIQELQTIKNYGIPIKIFIINNGIYGITKAYQKANMGGRCLACGPDGYSAPNFLRITEAYGLPVATIRINDAAHMRGVIRSVLDHDGPVVCDVQCPGFHEYEPKIVGWNTPIHDQTPLLPRDEFERNMA